MMYDLPERDNHGVTYILDADAIESKLSLAELPQRLATKSA